MTHGHPTVNSDLLQPVKLGLHLENAAEYSDHTPHEKPQHWKTA